jgi:uncharacterized Zn finger protein (UPF0148 family)
MSGFDEEAERERLREKYERDAEKRTATQRMSELLLKGATMTDKHCEVCGDPIFRHDGQEFCPTCQAEGRADEDAEAEPAAAESVESASSEPAPTESAAEPTESAAAASPTRPPTDRPERTPPGTGETDADRVADPAEQTGARERSAVAGRTAGDGDALAEARASLSRTLVRYARAAEETDDPRRARDLLAAAREAAETLAALDRP